MTSSLESGFWERPRLGHSKELIICTAFKTCHKVPAWKTGLWVGKMEMNMDERWVLSEEEGNMSLLGDKVQQKEDSSWALRRTTELLWAAFQGKSCPHLRCHRFKMPLNIMEVHTHSPPFTRITSSFEILETGDEVGWGKRRQGAGV